MKNIVICCDGTMGKYGTKSDNTNVVRLFERLIPDCMGPNFLLRPRCRHLQSPCEPPWGDSYRTAFSLSSVMASRGMCPKPTST